MNWQDIPIGMMQNDELFNALLALWKTRNTIAGTHNRNELTEMYELGFEEGLDAVAQLAGLSELFDKAKHEHRLRLERQLSQRAKSANGQIVIP